MERARLLLLGLLGALTSLGLVLGEPSEPWPPLAWDSTFCHVAVPGAGPTAGLRYLSFLSQGPAGLGLFHASWDGQGHLLECARQDQASITFLYLTTCVQELGHNSTSRTSAMVTPSSPFARAPNPALLAALSALQESWPACSGSRELWAGARRKRVIRSPREESLSQEPQGHVVAPVDRHQRARRGWTLPGTLWCGFGDSAENSSKLGFFQGPDKCCREHDNCAQSIGPFQFNYGIRNYRLHTISHCHCDTRFRRCLQRLRDSISDIVGVSFFNLLQIPCFVLKKEEECVEWHWWSGCKKYDSLPRAHLRPQKSYHHRLSPRPHRQRSQKTSSGKKTSRKQQLLPPLGKTGVGSVAPALPAQGTPRSLDRWEVGTLTTPPSNPTPGPASTPTHGRAGPPSPPESTAPPKEPTGRRSQQSKDGVPHRARERQHAKKSSKDGGPRAPGTLVPTWSNSTASLPHLPGKGKDHQGEGSGETLGEDGGGEVGVERTCNKKSCHCYQRLDQCENRIRPKESKFQLHNPHSHPLYHCNCTRRLARFLRKSRGFNEVSNELWDLLPTSCFELVAPEDCASGSSCSESLLAILMPTRHLQQLRRKQHHVQGEGPEWKKIKEKRRRRQEELQVPGKLFDICLQIVAARQRAPL
ncbi:group 3 secretory phospholipase A2 [Ornithorhynchus anatinus]|uniref:group 3 secretory phospholipase A2 n=1 Tax=Ornithorhynchus anatinus TaxID=9258 RepID=UPI0019D47B9B|nr:group 3 secretory phospholipase A2 [Ornithorhynchus anatinus]